MQMNICNDWSIQTITIPRWSVLVQTDLDSVMKALAHHTLSYTVKSNTAYVHET